MKAEVQLFLPRLIFAPGELVTGHVRLILHQPQKVLSIQLEFAGREKTVVSYETGSGKNRRTRYDNFKASICSIKCDYYTAKTEEEKQRLWAPGAYDYPLQLQLPNNIPKSWHSAGVDSIKYRLYTTVTQSTGIFSSPLKSEQELLIVHPQHRLHPEVNTGVSGTCTKKFMFSSKPLEMKVSLSQSVLYPGDSVRIFVDVQNHSSKKVNALKVKLIEVATIRANSHTAVKQSQVIKAEYPHFTMKGGEHKSEEVVYVVPTDLHSVHAPSITQHIASTWRLCVYLDVSLAIDPEVIFNNIPIVFPIDLLNCTAVINNRVHVDVNRLNQQQMAPIAPPVAPPSALPPAAQQPPMHYPPYSMQPGPTPSAPGLHQSEPSAPSSSIPVAPATDSPHSYGIDSSDKTATYGYGGYTQTQQPEGESDTDRLVSLFGDNPYGYKK